MQNMYREQLEKLMSNIHKHDIPEYGSTSDDANPMCVVKLVGKKLNWEWYVIESDKKGLFFGYVAGYYPELGLFDIKFLVENGAEVDTTFVPRLYKGLSEDIESKYFGN